MLERVFQRERFRGATGALTFTGGTGRFKNASGSATFTAIFDVLSELVCGRRTGHRAVQGMAFMRSREQSTGEETLASAAGRGLVARSWRYCGESMLRIGGFLFSRAEAPAVSSSSAADTPAN